MSDFRQVELPSLALALHELRGPLGFVASAARVMAGDANDNFLRGQCEMIERVATRMLATAQTVLSAASNVPPGAPVACNAATAVLRVIEDLRWMGFNVETQLPGEPVAISGSPQDFDCLLASLLLNAGDHGDLAHPVRVNLQAEDDHVLLVVTNRCCAVPRHRGHGLGSLVAARLAERLNATVAAHEHDGWFTTTVVLQLHREPVPVDAGPY